MSLAEIPPNHIRRNGQLASVQDGPSQKSLHLEGLSVATKRSSKLPKPIPIQSMLRKDTEVGDAGQFAVKPPRVITSIVTSSSLNPIKHHATPSKRRYPGTHQNGYRGHDGYHSPASPGNRSTGSNGFAPRSLGHRSMRRMASLEDYRSFSMTRRSYDNHSFINRHPLVGGYHPYGQGTTHASGSRLPYAYPSRLRRPGFRTVSPGPSDHHGSLQSVSQAPSREPSIRTISPGPGYDMTRTPSPFRYVVNRSDPHLQHYPPYLISGFPATRMAPMLSPQPATPDPSPILRDDRDLLRDGLNNPLINGSWPHSQTPPASPIFYDYTEDFVEHSQSNRITPSLEMSGHHHMPRTHSRSYPELAANSVVGHISELAADDRPEDLRMHSQLELQSMSQVDASVTDEMHKHMPLQDLSDVPELPETEATTIAKGMSSQDCTSPLFTNVSTLEPSQIGSVPSHDIAKDCTYIAEQDSEKLDQSMSGARTLEVSKTAFTDVCSSNSSMSSGRSSALPLAQSVETEVPGNISTPTPSDVIQQGSMQAANSYGGSSTGTLTEAVSDGYQSTSFEVGSTMSTAILSPTPERSMISPIVRDRFSKILAIDESISSPSSPSPQSRAVARVEGTSQMGFGAEKGLNGNGIAQGEDEVWRNPCAHLLTRVSTSNSSVNGLILAGECDRANRLQENPCRKCSDVTSCTTVPQPTKAPQSIISRPATSVQSRPPLSKTITLDDMRTGQIPPLPGGGQSTVKSIDPEESLISCKRTHAPSKDLPELPRPKSSIQSFSPPAQLDSSNLPLDFAPLIQRTSEEKVCAATASTPLNHVGQGDVALLGLKACLPHPPAEILSDRTSAAYSRKSVSSRPGSRPWNNESSYPWSDQTPELEVTMPKLSTDVTVQNEKNPRFKLHVHRASSSREGVSRLTRDLLSCDLGRLPAAPAQESTHRSAFRNKQIPNLAILPGQLNSSHDIIRSSRQQTRFVETFETSSPTSSFLPISPNHDVRSFFSDDSSQIRKKGSLRKRFSDFKARAVAARSASMDESQGHDRGLLTSALGRSRASGRSSRQSHTTTGAGSRMSHVRHVPRKLMNKIRLWLHRGDDKVRGWGWKLRYPSGRARSASTTLYAGV